MNLLDIAIMSVIILSQYRMSAAATEQVCLKIKKKTR